VQPERAERPDAAHAQDELLVEAHLAPADVQDVGDRPVLVGVVDDVRVEQEHRDTPDLCQPDGDGKPATGELQLDGEREPLGILDPRQR
jgi:hypothetical protein